MASPNIPVIGHCLGGQLMSKALGGKITRNPVKEIGWRRASGEDNAISRNWLGDFAGAAAQFSSGMAKPSVRQLALPGC
jgi:GMP synthase-like glutamine amidotransferase